MIAYIIYLLLALILAITLLGLISEIVEDINEHKQKKSWEETKARTERILEYERTKCKAVREVVEALARNRPGPSKRSPKKHEDNNDN